MREQERKSKARSKLLDDAGLPHAVQKIVRRSADDVLDTAPLDMLSPDAHNKDKVRLLWARPSATRWPAAAMASSATLSVKWAARLSHSTVCVCSPWMAGSSQQDVGDEEGEQVRVRVLLVYPPGYDAVERVDRQQQVTPASDLGRLRGTKQQEAH